MGDNPPTKACGLSLRTGGQTIVCLPVWEIICLLKFVDYLFVQADKPWFGLSACMRDNPPTKACGLSLCTGRQNIVWFVRLYGR